MTNTVEQTKVQQVPVIQIMVEWVPGQGVQIGAPASLDRTILLGILESAKAAVTNQMFNPAGAKSSIVIPRGSVA